MAVAEEGLFGVEPTLEDAEDSIVGGCELHDLASQNQSFICVPSQRLHLWSTFEARTVFFYGFL